MSIFAQILYTMKKFLFTSLILLSVNCYAQSQKTIVLKKGQIITAVSTNTSDADLGMGTMKNNSTTTTKILVADENKNGYVLTSTMTNMKMDIDGMGQKMSYDSDKPEDKDSQMGQAVSGKINSPSGFTLDKQTGKAILTDKKEDDAIAGAGIASIEGNENEAIEAAFLIIPTGKKTGDSWTDSSVDKGITTVKNYTIKSIEKDIASVELKGTMEGTTEREMQGMSMNMTINSKLTGQISVSVSTSCVIKSSVDSDITSSIEMMGQQMPANSKTNVTTVYSF